MKRTLGFVILTQNGAGDWYVGHQGYGSKYRAAEQGALFNTCDVIATLFPSRRAAERAVRISRTYWKDNQRAYRITRVVGVQ